MRLWIVSKGIDKMYIICLPVLGLFMLSLKSMLGIAQNRFIISATVYTNDQNRYSSCIYH